MSTLLRALPDSAWFKERIFLFGLLILGRVCFLTSQLIISLLRNYTFPVYLSRPFLTITFNRPQSYFFFFYYVQNYALFSKFVQFLSVLWP